jgi:hypothetical protein
MLVYNGAILIGTKIMANIDPLEAYIDEGIRESIKHGYHPTVFIGMRQRYKTKPAIEKLLISGEIQSGFKRLKELNLLQWSIEAAVMKFPSEFTPQARECAEFRLRLAKREAE